MTRRTAEITIDRSADDVWAAIGDFGDLAWYPGVVSCEIDGIDRTVAMRGIQSRFVERLLGLDDTGRSYSYGVVDVIGPRTLVLTDGSVHDLTAIVGCHEATITVLPETASTSRVVYEVDLDADESHVSALRDQYQRVLEHLVIRLTT
jgi:hypothetical protein